MNENTTTKRDLILEAAFQCFGQYGFKRVSMDDIAVATGLSRPALYNHFANKSDIFKACFQSMADGIVVKARAAAVAAPDLAAGLKALLQTAFLDVHREIGLLPHGDELLGMKTDLAADLLEKWLCEIEAVAADLIEAAATRNGLRDSIQGLSSRETARLLVNGMEGIKQRAASMDEAEQEMHRMVKLFTLALEGHRD